MMIRLQKKSLLLFCFGLSILLLIPGCSSRSGMDGKAKSRPEHPYVTDDFKAVIVFHPKKFYESKAMQELMAIEDVKQYVQDELFDSFNRTFKFDMRDLERFTVLVKNLPGGPRELPKIVMVCEFAEAADRTTTAQAMTDIEKPVEENGMHWYIPEDTRAKPIICVINDKTLLFSTHLDVAKRAAAAPAAKTPLNTRLVELDYKNQHFVMVGSRDVIPQPFMEQLQKEVKENGLPAALSEITDVMDEVQEVSAVANLDPILNIKLGIETSSKENTEKLLSVTTDSLTLLKTTLGFVLLRPPQGMPPSMRPVIQQALKILAKIELKQNGKQLDAAISLPEEMLATLKTALATGITDARTATQQMSSMNNMRQIGVAIHTYHEVYGQFPVAGRDTNHYRDGKPLLSWRVHLLPFLEEDILFQQFKLDEPWDSPHNLQLANRIPAIYVNPGNRGLGNKTTYLAPVGTGSIFGSDKKVGFRDVTDGTAGTIMMLDVGPDKAVPWTKPEDLPYGPDNPLQSLGDIGDSFMALFADGSALRLSNRIDSASLLGLFQRNDGELVDIKKFRN